MSAGTNRCPKCDGEMVQGFGIFLSRGDEKPTISFLIVLTYSFTLEIALRQRGLRFDLSRLRGLFIGFRGIRLGVNAKRQNPDRSDESPAPHRKRRRDTRNSSRLPRSVRPR